MAAGANQDVLTLVAQAKGFDATGKSIDKVNQELLAMFNSLGKVDKLNIESMLSKTGRRAGEAVGTLKVLAEILDKNNNRFVITAKRVGEAGNQYELLATKVKRSTKVISDAEKKAADTAAAAKQRRIEAVDRAIEASKREMKQMEEAARAAVRQAKQNDVTDINRQLGGFKGSLTNAGMLSIERANKNLLDLLSKSNISTPRLNEIFTAVQKNDRNVLDNLTEGEQKVSIALRRLSAAFDQASNAGQRTQNVLIGFRGMLRLLEVQQLHSIISGLTSYFEQASAKSVELTGHIAAIQTISQKAQQSTDDWRNSLVRLSNAYGFDVIDVAKAGYEAISNQIARGAAITPFLAQAFEFARATASSAAESVDVLSSALNGYGLSIESTQKISAILFKTIDLGRVKASELANTLGNSTPIASALGISFEELMAGLSTLTIQGIRTDTALTLMNNIMLKLMKPTKGMQELFDEWGVSSGEAAIKTFGLLGVFERLSAVAEKGGIAAIAEDLSDMRAIRAVEGFLSNNSLEVYKKNLKEITQGQEEYANAVTMTANAMQAKLAVEFQKLNNLFIGNVGFRKNEMFLSAIEQIGGLDKAVEGFANAMLSTTDILMRMAIPFVNLNTLLERFHFGVSSLAPTLLTAGTAYLVMYRAGNMLSALLPILNKGVQNTSSVAHPAATALVSLGERMGIVNRHAFNGSLQFTAFASRLASIATNAIPAVIGAYFLLQAIQEENERRMLSGGSDFLSSMAESSAQANKQIQKSAEELGEGLTSSLTKNLKELSLYWSVFQSRLNVLGKESLKSTSKFALEDFENSLIGKNSIERLKLLSDRFNELSLDIENLFDARNFKGAQDALEKILDVTKQFKDEQRKVTEEVKKTTEQLRISAEDKAFEYKYFTKSDNRKMKAYGRLSAQFQNEALEAFDLNDLEKADKLIERALEARQRSMSLSESIVSSQGYGKPKGLAQFQDLLETRARIQSAIGDAAMMGTRGDEMEKWARDTYDRVNENVDNLSKIESKFQIAVSTIEKLKDMMKQATAKLANDKSARFEEMAQLAASATDVYNRTSPNQKGMLWYYDTASKYTLRGALSKQFLDIESNYNNLRKLNDELKKGLMKDSGVSEDEIVNRAEKVRQALEQIYAAQVKLKISAVKANQYTFEQVPILLDQATGSGLSRKTDREVIENALKLSFQAGETAQSVKDQEALITKFRAERDLAESELVTVKNELGDLFKEKLPETFKAATEAIKAAHDPMKSIQDSLKESLKGVREEVEKLILKVRDLKVAPPPVTPPGNALGGLMMGGAFAGGGFINGPLGRDNLFIRAHAGEFIVNAEAAQRFYPQLTAMNSMYSSAPAYNNGGPITQVGDIHINANLTGQTDVDVIALGKALRREIKRGTVRLT